MVYDLIIVGGGPAGITAGIFGARKKLSTLLISKDFLGQVGLTFLIENYPGIKEISGIELSQKFKNHVKKFSLSIKEEEVKEIRKNKQGFAVYTKSKKSYLSKALIIASGRKPRFLNIPGEKELMGQGVSFCSICDAPFFQDKIVAIIGGGNSGFETALDLAKYAKKIFIFEILSQVKADETVQEKIKNLKKVKIFLNKEVKEIKGKGKVESIIIQDKISQKISEIPVEGVFIQAGSVPVISFVNPVRKDGEIELSNGVKGLVDFNKLNEIIINPLTNETKTSGLFAAGDVTDIKYKQIIIAAGEGAKAALSAYEYLKKLKTQP